MKKEFPSLPTPPPARWQRFRDYLRHELSGVFIWPRSRGGRGAFVVILLVGIWLRVGGLDWGLSYTQPIGPPHHDEPHVMHFIKLPWEEYKKQFHEYEIVRPVFMWRVISRPIYAIAGRLDLNDSNNLVVEYAVPRAVNSFFGVLGLLAIYGLGVRLGGVRSGLLAMGLLAVAPGHWYYSQLLKGDLLVTTFDTILLLCAIQIYSRGTRFWYVLAGVIAGLGIASKPSVVIILPIVLLAHLARAVAQRRWRELVSYNAWLTLGSATAAFFVLYPYPFIDFARWWTVLTEPTTQSFLISWKLTPQSFLTSWQDYNKPPQVFMEMVFGEALRLALPITAALFAGLTYLAWRAKQAMPYALTLLAAIMVYHSLSFSPPLDDRYALPLVIFAVLFPAVLAGSYSFARSSARVVAATALCAVLLIYTVGVTWVMFPLFTFGTDIRLATVNFIEDALKPGEIVGEFEAGGRQSLPFDRSTTVSTRVRSHEEDPHMFMFSQPDYLVVPVEPDNYDHAFRYQLYTPALQEEFGQYVTSFDHLKRFGEQPSLFGRSLPRLLSTPIFDVYRYRAPRAANAASLTSSGDTWQTVQGAPANPRQPLTLSAPLTILRASVLSRADLTGKLLTFTFDISDVQVQRQRETLEVGTLTAFLLLDRDEAGLAQGLDPIETDIALLDHAGRLGLTIPLKYPDLINQDRLRVAFYFRPDGRIEVDRTIHDKLVGQIITPAKTFSSLQVGVGVSPETPSPTMIKLVDVTLETPLGL